MHPVPSTSNGLFFQDSLNPFYNNSTNFFPMYYHKGKVTNANIQSYGGSENIAYSLGLGYYNESGILKGSGFNRIDLNSSLNIIPVNKLTADLRLNASLSNKVTVPLIRGFRVRLFSVSFPATLSTSVLCTRVKALPCGIISSIR